MPRHAPQRRWYLVLLVVGLSIPWLAPCVMAGRLVSHHPAPAELCGPSCGPVSMPTPAPVTLPLPVHLLPLPQPLVHLARVLQPLVYSLVPRASSPTRAPPHAAL